MNIFETASGFIGKFDPEKYKDSLRDIFQMAGEIKGQLGKKGYLLDTYLSLFLKATCTALAYDSGDQGFQTGCELRKLCRSVVDRTEEMTEHPLYAATRKVFLEHDEFRQYQERYTQLCLLYVEMSDQFMAYIVEEFIREQKSDIDSEIDVLRLKELFQIIAKEVGEAKMEELNVKLKERLIIASPVAIFLQGLADDLNFTLITRDIETNQMIFHLSLD